jgi:hypothetical protein
MIATGIWLYITLDNELLNMSVRISAVDMSSSRWKELNYTSVYQCTKKQIIEVCQIYKVYDTVVKEEKHGTYQIINRL